MKQSSLEGMMGKQRLEDRIPERVKQFIRAEVPTGQELLVATVNRDGDVGWTAYDLETGEGRDASDDINAILDD